MVKTKLFFPSQEKDLDAQINEFLAGNNACYIDVKLIGVDNVSFTQCSYMALLIYREYIPIDSDVPF